jgi:hypothetical protein
MAERKIPKRAQQKMEQLQTAVEEGFQAKSPLGQAFARFLKEQEEAGPLVSMFRNNLRDVFSNRFVVKNFPMLRGD